jgi:hypothetical protein
MKMRPTHKQDGLVLVATLILVAGSVWLLPRQKSTRPVNAVYDQVQQAIEADPNYHGIYARIETIRVLSKWRGQYNLFVKRFPGFGNKVKLGPTLEQVILVSEFIPGTTSSSGFLKKFEVPKTQSGVRVLPDSKSLYARMAHSVDMIPYNTDRGISCRNDGQIEHAKRYFHGAIQAGGGRAALELAKLYMSCGNESENVRKYLVIAVDCPNTSKTDIDEARQLLSALKVDDI